MSAILRLDSQPCIETTQKAAFIISFLESLEIEEKILKMMS